MKLFFLHFVGAAAHGVGDKGSDDSDADEDIECRKNLAERGVGHDVAIPDGCQRYDTEIVGIDPFEVFHVVIYHGAGS